MTTSHFKTRDIKKKVHRRSPKNSSTVNQEKGIKRENLLILILHLMLPLLFMREKMLSLVPLTLISYQITSQDLSYFFQGKVTPFRTHRNVRYFFQLQSYFWFANFQNLSDKKKNLIQSLTDKTGQKKWGWCIIGLRDFFFFCPSSCGKMRITSQAWENKIKNDDHQYHQHRDDHHKSSL